MLAQCHEPTLGERILSSGYNLDLFTMFTLMTSLGSDTVTSIFKCNSSNTITSLRLLKMA